MCSYILYVFLSVQSSCVGAHYISVCFGCCVSCKADAHEGRKSGGSSKCEFKSSNFLRSSNWSFAKVGNGLGRADKILIYNPPTSRDHPPDTLRLQSVTGGHLASAQILLSHGTEVHTQRLHFKRDRTIVGRVFVSADSWREMASTIPALTSLLMTNGEGGSQSGRWGGQSRSWSGAVALIAGRQTEEQSPRVRAILPITWWVG